MDTKSNGKFIEVIMDDNSIKRQIELAKKIMEEDKKILKCLSKI